jgi:hypothetical protein
MILIEKILKLILSIDFFAIKPKLNINNNYSYGTYYGAVISLLICVILSIVFFTQFFKIVLHTEPTLITTIYNDEDPKKINITRNNFILTFSLQDINYDNYINESIYFVSASLSNVNLFPNGTNHVIESNISVIKCSEYNFSLIPDYFKNLPLNNLYCINESAISIQGQFKKKIWSYINLKFYVCKQNKNNENKCASENEIQSRLSGGFIGMFMTDFNVIPNNYSHPITIFGTNVYNAFSIKNHIDYWMYLKPIEVITDNGYFMQNKKKENFFALDYTKSDMYNLDDNSNFLTLVIRVSPRRDVYERTYLKIQGAAATIGGMINLCITVGQILAYFFNLTLYKYFFLQFFIPNDKIFKIGLNRVNIRKIKSHRLRHKSSKSIIFNFNADNIKKKNFSENNVINLKQNNNIMKSVNFNLYNKENDNLIRNDSNQNSNIILLKNGDENRIKPKRIIKFSNKSLKIKSFKNFGQNYDSETKKGMNEPVNNNINNTIKIGNHSLISKVNNNNLNEYENEFNNDNSNDFSLEHTNFIINFKQKKLKKYIICTKIFCTRGCCLRISEIHRKFNLINFLFDLIHFLKTKNEINLIKNELYNYEQKKAINTMYTFDTDFYHEKLAYDLIIIDHKNK